MLPFHESIVSELVEADGVSVLAAGLGTVQVMAALLRIQLGDAPQQKGLVFILSATDEQRQVRRGVRTNHG